MRSVLSIRDLIAEIVRYIWIVIVCAVLFGVLLGGYKYAKDLTASKQVVEEIELTDMFTEEEINQINTYVALKNRYLNFVEHVYSVPIMQLNAHNVDTVSLQYLVSAQDLDEKDDVVSAYIGYINNGNLAQAVAEDMDMDAADVQVLLHHVSRDSLYVQNELTGVIELKIWGRTTEESKELAKVVKAYLSDFGKTLVSSGLSHSMESLDESVLKIYDNDLYAEQVTYTSNIEKELTFVTNHEATLNDAQLAAADKLIVSEEDVEEDGADVVTTKVGISKKYVVLGALLGGVAAVGIIVAWYILTATIKFSEEIRMVYGVRYLGQISFKKKNGCEVLANKLFYASKLQSIENQKELLYSKILITCETEGIKEFVLTGDFDKNKEYILELQKKLAESGIAVKVVGDILNQPDALKELKGEKNIIFAETIKKSRYENVHQEIVLCDEQNINVLGYIIFE